MKYSILFFFLFFSTFGNDKNPIFTRILKIQPNLDKKYAFKISNEIYRCHKEINFDKYLLVAIYNQESSLRVDSINSTEGFLNQGSLKKISKILKNNKIDDNKVNDILDKINKNIFKVDHDFGIAQISYRNIIRLKYCSDKEKLISDTNYSIKCSCNILKNLKKKYFKERNWWTRYFSSTPKLRGQYFEKVMRFYPLEY